MNKINQKKKSYGFTQVEDKSSEKEILTMENGDGKGRLRDENVRIQSRESLSELGTRFVLRRPRFHL